MASPRPGLDQPAGRMLAPEPHVGHPWSRTRASAPTLSPSPDSRWFTVSAGRQGSAEPSWSGLELYGPPHLSGFRTESAGISGASARERDDAQLLGDVSYVSIVTAYYYGYLSL